MIEREATTHNLLTHTHIHTQNDNRQIKTVMRKTNHPQQPPQQQLQSLLRVPLPRVKGTALLCCDLSLLPHLLTQSLFSYCQRNCGVWSTISLTMVLMFPISSLRMVSLIRSRRKPHPQSQLHTTLLYLFDLIRFIRECLDTGTAFPASLGDEGTHAVAETLVCFLGDLPSPIIPDALYQQCIEYSSTRELCCQVSPKNNYILNFTIISPTLSLLTTQSHNHICSHQLILSLTHNKYSLYHFAFFPFSLSLLFHSLTFSHSFCYSSENCATAQHQLCSVALSRVSYA